ncbi:HAMP domain-containing protein [Kitasatospora camelliae]|uniref:histidine kinase n=1 Tax=Kitasatospora camelliae TaxID=3156397 RepID=A0AAU8JUB9_9ACTN
MTISIHPPRRRRRMRRRADMPLLGGIRPPIAVLLLLLVVVSGITALTVGGFRVDEIPQAVRESQQYTAEDGAVAVRSAINENVDDLRRFAEQYDKGSAEPDAVLAALSQTHQKWRGTAVVVPATGRLLAARGEAVPLAGLDLTKSAGTATPAPLLATANGGTRLLTFGTVTVKSSGRVLLVASDTLKVPAMATSKEQTVQVLGATGAAVDTAGPEPATDADKRLFASAREKASHARPTAQVPTVSGALVGPADDKGARRVAGYAAVTSADPQDAAGSLGLTVVSGVSVERHQAELRHPLLGLVAAGSLLLVGLVVAGVLLRTLQRPLLRLFLESRRLSRGERLDQPVAGPKRGEAGRTVRALEELRLQLLDPRREPPEPAPPRRRPGILLPLTLCAVVILGWSVPLTLLSSDRDAVAVPGDVVAAQKNRTDSLATRVRQALSESTSDLKPLAAALDGSRKPDSRLRAALDEHPRYRSIYLLGTDGSVTAKAGEVSSHAAAAAELPDGIALLNTSGNEPVFAAIIGMDTAGTTESTGSTGSAGSTSAGTVIQATATASPAPIATPSAGTAATPSAAPTATPSAGATATPSAGATTDAGGKTADGRTPRRPVLVGELKRDFVSGLLDRPGLGEIWLVDGRKRIVGANEAFGSFAELPDSRARRQVDKADKETAVSVSRSGGNAVVLAAARLDGSGQVAKLGWSVVTSQPVGWLHLDQNKADRRALLAAMLGLAAAALCLGWLFIAVGLPLRRLAANAEALAAGDRRTVLYPVHHDEVGAVVRSLEVIRQQLEQRARRAGDQGARRPRTAERTAERSDPSSAQPAGRRPADHSAGRDAGHR